MGRGSPTPSPPLPSSPGSLSHSSSSTATSTSSAFDRSPPPSVVSLEIASPAKSITLPFLPSAPIPTATASPPPLHGAHSSTRYPLAVSPSAKRANSAASPPPFFAPTATLSDVPQPSPRHNPHTLTSFDFPTTPQPPVTASTQAGGPAKAGARTRRQSQKPGANGGFPAASGGAATPGGDAANQLEAKVVILGSQGVGKTSIVHRYTSGAFSRSLTSTIGASFLTKRLVVDGCKVRLQLWDTAGQERFRSMAPLYYRGALAAILVYDITSMDSFNDVKIWLDELRRNMSPDLIIAVVGSKVDLAPTHRAVDLAFARRSVAEWVTQEEDEPYAYPPSRDPSPPSPTRPRTRTMSTRAHPPGLGLTTSPSLPVITTTRSEQPPSLGARVRKMSTKLSAPAPSGTSTGGNSSSASSVSDMGSLSVAAPGDGMVRSGSKLGLSLGLSSKSSSRGRKSHEEERRTQEELERERVEEMIRDCGVEVSEVSGKDDYGIEDLFFDITRRLVERKAQIESDRVLRSRDSIMIHDSSESPTAAVGGMCC